MKWEIVDCVQDNFVLALVIQFLLTSNDLRKQALNGNVLDVCSHAIKVVTVAEPVQWQA